MIASQYKIILPSNYDMDIIRGRVASNGYKTDGFQDLKFKMYLITQKGENSNLQNSYCPLYIWRDSRGLNKFLFEGFYDNILGSFGWQQVNIGVPLIDTTSSFENIRYVLEITKDIKSQECLKNFKDIIEKDMIKFHNTEYVVIYNPDKWKYSIFYFIDDLEKIRGIEGIVYDILHISQ